MGTSLSLSKKGAITLIGVFLLVFIVVALVSIPSFANAQKTNTYVLGEKVEVPLPSGDYKIEIVSPRETSVQKATQTFTFVPTVLGKHRIQISGDAKETIHFTVTKSFKEEKREPLQKSFVKEEASATLESQEFVYNKVEVNKVVHWKKKINTSGQITKVSVPEYASNVSVYESGEELDFEIDSSVVTGILNVFSQEKQKSIAVASATPHIEVEYTTPAPLKEEKIISPNKKEVKVHSPYHYEDVRATTAVPEMVPLNKRNLIKIWWKEEERFLPFIALDQNKNGMIDAVQWEIEHLSNQTFDIIVIEKAQHLNRTRDFVKDVYASVFELDNTWVTIPQEEYVRVTFEQNLTSKNDITIYARSSEPATVEVYIKDQNVKVAEFDAIASKRYHKVFLDSLQGAHQTFDLKVKGADVDFDLIIDPAFYTIDSDSFEDDDLVSDNGINWSTYTTGGTLDTHNERASNGSFSMRSGNAAFTLQTATLAINATEYTNISVSYYRAETGGWEPTDFFSFSWYNGSDWVVEEQIFNDWGATFVYQSFNLGTAADNNPDLAINFTHDNPTGGGSEELWIDGVVVRGYRNFAPNQTTPILNSTDGSNTTETNLTVYPQSTDPDNDTVRDIISWYAEGSPIMLLHMPFDSNNSNGVNSTKDYSGNNFSGQLGTSAVGDSNEPTWNETGLIQGAFEFDSGSATYIAIHDYFYEANSNPTEVTAMAWIRTTATDGIIATYDRNEFWRLEVGGFASNGDLGFQVFTDAGQLDWSSNTAVNDGNWHHVVGVFDNGNVSMYIDGVLDNNTTQGSYMAGDVNRYGCIGSNSESTTFNADCLGDHFTGTIDEVRVYNRSLSPEQIAAIYVNRTDRIVSNETLGGETWQACVTPNDGLTDGEIACSNSLKVTSNLVQANQIQCEEAGAFKECNQVDFSETITRVRVNCTDPDNAITNASFTFYNFEDDKTYFSANATSNSSEWWIYDNTDVQVNDSGNFSINASCWSDTTPSTNQSNWTIGWGDLSITLIDPNSNTNVFHNYTFNFSVQVVCTGGECGDVNATLDPFIIKKEKEAIDLFKGIPLNIPKVFLQSQERTNIEILDPQSFPMLGGLWQTNFKTTGKGDLRVAPTKGTTWGRNENANDLQFLEVGCDNDLVEYEWDKNSAVVRDFECSGTAYGRVRTVTSGKHHLEFDFGGQKGYANNLVSYVRSGGATGTTLTFNISEPDTNRLVVVFADDESTGTSLTGVTVDGNACNVVGVADNPTGAGNHMELWYCDESDLGNSNNSVTVAITGGDTGWALHAHLYTGVNQSGPIENQTDDTSATQFEIQPGPINITENGLIVFGAANGQSGTYNDADWDTSPTEGVDDGLNPEIEMTEVTDSPNPASAVLATAYWISNTTAQTNRSFRARGSVSNNRGTGILASWNLYVDPGKGGVIPMNAGNPFYTTSQNPMDPANTACLAAMASNTCNVTWVVNTTGDIGGTYEFFILANATNYTSYVAGNESNRINLTIVEFSGPPPNITINTPVNGSTIADVTPTLNVTLSGQADTLWYTTNGGSTNVTMCSDCSGEQTTFIGLLEGNFEITVYSNNSLNEQNSNTTNFTIDMNYNYYDDYDDNSSLLNQILNGVVWQIGNLTYTGGGTTDRNFDEAEDLNLSGGMVSTTNCICASPSGGDCVRHEGTLGDQGNVTELSFPNTTGQYNVTFRYCDEDDDGVGTEDDYAVYVNGQVVSTTNSSPGGSSVWMQHSFLTDLAFGDQLDIGCIQGSAATFCRVDWLNVTGTGGGTTQGNFTAYNINTSATIVEISNITWDESGTNTDNNLSVEVSADAGQNWYTATKGQSILGIATGTSLLYRVLFTTNDSGVNISLLDMNISWSDQASPPPNITINTPVSGSTIADVTPTLNVTLSGEANTLWYTIDGGATNVTMCTSCSGEQTTFLPLEEGGYTAVVYASNVLGVQSSNQTTFTVDMNYNYYDNFDDNSSLLYAIINNVTWQIGNISYTPPPTTILLNETFESSSDWTLTGGSWTITSNQLHQTANSAGTTAINDNINLSAGISYNISMEAYDDDNDDTGIIFRYRDSSNYYRCRFNLQSLSSALERIDGGSTNTLDTTSSSYTENANNDYIVEIIDNNITCYLNGVPVMSAIDTNWEDGGVGIYNAFHDEALYDNYVVKELPSNLHGNFTAYNINTSATIVEISNITWDESGTNTNNNISVEISADAGQNWYAATKGQSVTGIATGTSLVYRVLFNTNGSASNIALLDMNISWTDSAPATPNITINTPVNGSTIADVTPTLNITLDATANTLWYSLDSGSTNTTICVNCAGEQTTFLPLEEGGYTVVVYANNSLGSTNTNQTAFTVDMDRNYYDNFDDNSSLLYAIINNVTWQVGNISLIPETTTTLLFETFESSSGWTLTGGSWGITSSQLHQSSNSAGTTAINDNINLSAGVNYNISMEAYDDDNDDTGIIFRYRDSSNYYRCRFNVQTGSNALERIDGGSTNTLDTTASTYTENARNNYTVNIHQNNITCYINGQPVMSAIDSNWEDGGVGIYNSFHDEALYDNFTVLRLPSRYRANFTAYNINTTQPIKSIVNITWNEAGTSTDHNITVQVSADAGQNWYNATSGQPISSITTGSSLVYRVMFASLDATALISLLDMNITWSAPPEVNITYPSPVTYTATVMQLNYTVIPGTGVSLDTCWYSLDGGASNTTITCGQNVTGLTSVEGNNTWTVYANDSEGAIGQDSVTFNMDTGAPNITFINQTDDDEEIVNETHSLEEGQNLTIRVNVTDQNLESVWVVVWQTVKGGLEQARVFFSYVAGLGLWVADIATDYSWGLSYNYTIYANDTSNQTSEYDGNFTILKLNSTLSLDPNPTDGTGNFTMSGLLQFTNNSLLTNHPINLWIDGELLLLENLTAVGTYNNYPNVTDTSNSDFDRGTYYQTTTDGENVTLSGQNTTGNFTRTIDAGAKVEWNSIAWQATGQSCSATLTWQEGVDNFADTADTYVDGSNANTNYGTSTDLFTDTDPTQRTLLQFDIIGYGGGRIPFNSTITSANMTVSVYDAGNVVSVYEVLEEWAETEATYNNRLTGGTAWGSTGVAAPPSRSATLEDTFNPSAVGNYSFDITNAMRRWVNHTGTNYGVVLSPGGTNTVGMRSSEYSVVAERPQIYADFSSSDCTSVIFYARFSDDNATWSSWQEVTNQGPLTMPNRASRYLQYRAVLSSVNSSITPFLNEITANYTAVVTDASGAYAYNLSSPTTFGSYEILMNSSYRTIYTNDTVTLSVQSGVSPIISLVSPADVTWFNYSNLTLTYNASDANDDIANTTLHINGVYNQTNATAVLNGGVSNFTINFTSGQYNWSVNVTDQASNMANSSQRTFYIDLEDPNITLIYPSNASNFTLSEVNLSFSVTDNLDDILVCDITLDGSIIHAGIAAPNGTAINRSSGTLTNGLHDWNVTCVDESNRSVTSQTWQINITDTPPNVSLLSPQQNYIDADGHINFTYYPTDNSGFLGCSLLINDTVVAVNQSAILGGENNTINWSGIAEGFHNWTIECEDLSSSTHRPTSRDFTVDLTNPSIDLNAPSNASTSLSSTVHFNFTANDTIDTSLSCNLTLDGSIVDNFSATAGALTNRILQNLTDGNKFWNVTCLDDAGRSNTSQTWEVNVTEHPAVTLDTANQTFFGTDSPTLLYTPFDNTNLSVCDLYINGAYNQSNETTIQNGVQGNFEVSGLSDGAYQWYVNCSDLIGLRNTSEERTFYIDTEAPNISLESPLGVDVFATNITFNFTVTDAISSSLVCNLTVDTTVVDANFNVTNATQVNRTISGITDGFHTWFVNCTDTAGNANGSIIANFTRVTAPDLTLIRPSDGFWFNKSDINLTYLPQDDEGIDISYLILNDVINQTNTTTVTTGIDNNFSINLSDGLYNWTVIITDVSGTNGTATARDFYIDTQPPQINLNAPNNSELVTTNNVTFNFTPIDNLDTNIFCNLTVDGSLEFSGNIANATDSVHYLLIVDGNHSWNVSCIDEANHITYSQTRNFTVEAPPNVTLNTPADGFRSNGSDFVFNYTPYDPIGITQCSLYIDDVLNQTEVSIVANQPNNFTVTGVPEGQHNWTVNCTDPDANTDQAAARIFYSDLTPPSIQLNAPANNSGEDANTATVLFNWTATDALDVLLTCDLIVNGVVERDNVLVTSGVERTESVAGLPVGINTWNVTCWDTVNNTNTSETRIFNRTYPDFQINTSLINFSSDNPTENETITLNATIYNLGATDSSGVVVQFYLGDPESGGTQLGSNQTITVPAGGSNSSAITWNVSLGTSQIFVAVDPPLDTNGSLQEGNESNNKASKNLTVGSWHFFYGDIESSSQFVLDDANDSSILRWNTSGLDDVNIYVTDYDSSVGWENIQAIGKDSSDTNTTNDFSEIDTNLGMENFTDSTSALYVHGGNVNDTGSFNIFSNVIDDVPLTVSINSSNFKTGILWDVTDDSNGEYDASEDEDLIFISQISQDTVGSVGVADYEIRVPAKLRNYIGPDARSAAFYIEII